MMADKDIAGVVAAMRHRVDRWLPCDLPGPRAATATSLAGIIAKVGAGETAPAFASTAAALLYAQENAGVDDRILAFGSFLTVAGVMHSLNRGDR